jgi:serine/threonine protein phosphatase PrpC
MKDVKPYLEKLLQQNGIQIENRHSTIFEAFTKEEESIISFNLIRKTQLHMIEKWKEKIQIEEIKTKHIIVSNGTVGKQYDFILDFKNNLISGLGEYKIELDENIGITFNAEENRFFGIPKEAGEHTILFLFKLKDSTVEQPFNEKEIKLIINPDPKSLWVEKDSNKSDPYWKKDIDAAHSELSSRQLVIASKRGRSHAQEGIFRDDDFSYAFFEGSGWGLIAVADGAGGSKYSRKGSQIACQELIKYFENVEKEKLTDIEYAIHENFINSSEENQKKLSGLFIELLGSAALWAQIKIRDEAIANNSVIKDYSTTLIFALVKRYENSFVIASFWVGDGGIGIYNKDKNSVTILGTPDSGEFAGQTRFLTMNDIFTDGAYASRVRFKIVDDFTALILMTDGITDPKFQTDNNLNKIEYWHELWADLNGTNQDNCNVDFSKPLVDIQQDLINWLDFWSPGNHDDRTIAILF